MLRRSYLVILLLCILLLSGAGSPQPPAFDVDVLIYGGTSGGVIAAYTAKLYGKSVLLVEPGRHLGGMSSGGLGQTDIGNKYAVTGLSLDFYRRLGSYYGRFEAWQFEPHVAEQIFERYIDHVGVEVLFSRRVKSIEKEGTQIKTVTLEYSGYGASSPDLVVSAKVFIDTSYEGDLMAMSGASFIVGREDNRVHNETLNGVQLLTGHQFPDGVDPYVVEGDSTSGLLPEITGIGVAPAGTGDRGVQAYNFRMCLCNREEDRLPITRPDNYDPDRYELLLRLIEKTQPERLDQLFIISSMPESKTDWNNRGGFSTDFIGKNWAYPEANYDERVQIWEAHQDYQKGLLYFLSNDEQVPAHLRNEMQEWGYCRDEFLDTRGWPHQLYVREARRLIGEYVMTEHNCVGRDVVEDAIGMAAYTMDSHNVQRVVVKGADGNAMVKNEGNVEVGGFPPYPIAYRSITPKRNEVTNLLVPVALSASHIAYGSIRMEPVFMVLGQSAAVAASMAIDANIPVQMVDIPALQQELLDNPLADGSTPEILIDDGSDLQVQITGSWTSTHSDGQHGPTVLKSTDRNGAVRFSPDIQEDGKYRVYLYWPRHEELSTQIPVSIRHAGGVDRIVVNMRSPEQASQDAGLQHGIASWVLLGEYEFRSDQEAFLEISSDASDGFAFADAVLFAPTNE